MQSLRAISCRERLPVYERRLIESDKALSCSLSRPRVIIFFRIALREFVRELKETTSINTLIVLHVIERRSPIRQLI